MCDSDLAQKVILYDTIAPTENKVKFLCDDVVYTHISDTNQGNYASQFVSYSGLSSTGVQSDILQHWNQAYHSMPIECNLKLSGELNNAGKWEPTIIPLELTTGGVVPQQDSINKVKELLSGFDTKDKQRYGICPKNTIHMVDNVTVKWDNVTVTNNENFQNMYRHLQSLNWKDEKMKTMGQMEGFVLDDGEDIIMDPLVGEINNGTDAHKLRCEYLNYNFYTGKDAANTADLLTNVMDNKLGGCIADTKSGSTNAVTQLKYHWFLKKKLASQHDFFRSLPSLGSVTSFDFRFQFNVGSNSNWLIEYELEVTDGNSSDQDPAFPNDPTKTVDQRILKIKPVKIVYNKSAGNTCPFMIGEIGEYLKFPNLPTLGEEHVIVEKVTAGTASDELEIGRYRFSIKIDCSIGSNTYCKKPFEIVLPSIKYDADSVQEMLSGSTKLYYNDFVFHRLDGTNKIEGNGTRNKRINFSMNLSKVDKIYFVPILDSSDTTKFASGVLPFESPVSSCPNTINYGLKIKDIQLILGNQRLYPDKIRQEEEFYDHRVAGYFSTTKSALYQDDDYGGQLTLQKWRAGYGVYVFDLTRTVLESAFVAPRSYQCELTVESSYNWQMFLFFSQEKNLTIQNFNGSLDKDQL